MRKNNCELIRRELDELTFGERHSSAATEHLRECASCREFHEQQTTLRQIVGSLGTVEAPADFDFRLRARLASDASGVSSIYWPLLRRGLAVAAMVLVFVTGAVVVRNVLNEPPKGDQVAGQPETRQPAKQDDAPPVVKEDQNREQPVATVVDYGPQNLRKTLRPHNDFQKRRLSTIDSSFGVAKVIKGAEPVGVSAAFPIDASLQPFKVSLDDGSGNAKIVSVPTISFGSERIGQSGNQFAPKRDW